MATRAADPLHSTKATRAAVLAIVVGVIGFGLKLTGWLLTDSDAVFSDALESIVNIVASVGAYLALFYASRPPDEEHPYGHGPIEFVSALFEGVLIAVAGVVVLVQCSESFTRGRPPIERIDLGLLFVAASAVLNGVVGYVLLRVGRQTGSAALVGDGRHLLTDLWTTFAVLGSLLLVRVTDEPRIDTVVALIVGLALVVVGARLARTGLSSILGEQDAEDHRKIVAILESHRAHGDMQHPATICSYASVRHRHQGRTHFIDMHLRVPRDMTVAESHDIASRIEHEVLAAVGEGTATAHMEPCGDTECVRCASRALRA
ncbi:MAG: cation diffusion facilitator family transporter [Limnohabitans sp.]|jgi:cation diffusion facilitator family transporter|nr:cation diffusion facilitator family transporter [Limnohabitans sp.]